MNTSVICTCEETIQFN